MGEIQALRLCDIQPDQIIVSHSWDRKYGLKGTKTGEVRTVPIPLLLYNTIMRVADSSREYIFSIRDMAPMNNSTIKYGLYKALDGISIGDEKRKARNITFHSWRHYFNTKLRVSGVPDVVVQSVIGHKNMAMTANYTNSANVPLDSVRDIQLQVAQ
jgi:integrase